MLTFMVTAIEMMHFGIVDNSSGKDKLLTKICVLVLSAFIAVLLFFSYNFVYKPEAPYLDNYYVNNHTPVAKSGGMEVYKYENNDSKTFTLGGNVGRAFSLQNRALTKKVAYCRIKSLEKVD